MAFDLDGFFEDGIGAVKDIAVAKYQAQVSKAATEQAQMQATVSTLEAGNGDTGGYLGAGSSMGGNSKMMVVGLGVLGLVVAAVLMLKR